jgi:regulator of protease activity HflC (stomatin/prohibitin superfamily)
LIALIVTIVLMALAWGIIVTVKAIMESDIKFPKWINWSPLLILVVALFFGTVVVIPAGNVGVVTRFGAVTGTNFEQGLHVKVPFVEGVTVFDIRTQKDQVDASAASQDLQEVKSTIAVNYHLDATQASTVFAEVGEQYKQRVVDPAVQESFKATTAQFTAEQLITQREAVKSKAMGFLKERLTKFHVIIDEFNIVNFDFSADFNQAIEAKQVAQQNVEKAKRDLERITIEAQQKIAKAEGESKAQQLQQSTLTQLYIDYLGMQNQATAIQKWDGKLPTVTGGAVPFISIPSK